MENLILFDLDGTLTPARMKAEREIVRHLVKLSHCADIGIVSGSPWEYIGGQSKKFNIIFYIPS